MGKEIVAQSLQTALHDVVVVSAATHESRGVSVEKLRPRDVTAMIEMAKVRDRKWRFLNGEPIRRLERAVGILLVLESALLPALAVFPDEPSVMISLGNYTGHLAVHAAAAGGDFATEAEKLCAKLRDYRERADEEEAEQLKVRSDFLLKEVTALLDTELTICKGRKRK
jgi:hypothetical protein